MAEQFRTILRRKEVERRVGLSRSTIYLRVARGEFPSPISLGVRAVGRPSDAIDAWIADRIAQSRKISA